MARLLVLVLVLVLVPLALLCGAASGSTNVTVKPGGDATLQCQSDDVNITAAEWTRSDLEDPEYVLFYRDRRSDPTNQHSSFRDRVQLVNKDLKTGDVSLILRNVSRNDEGTYERRVKTGGSRRKKRGLPHFRTIRTVQLQASASGSTVVTVKTGRDVTLPCQSADVPIRAVEWTRSDLEKTKYVILYTDGHSDTANQHSSFRDRVELVDKDLKTKDVSLILKNVNRNDEGTYECRVPADGSRRKKRGAIPDFRTISIVQLKVSDSGAGKQQADKSHEEQPDGDQNSGTPHLHIGLGAAAGLVGLVVVGFFLVQKRRRQPQIRTIIRTIMSII